jgi:DNA-binding GntR family transcriptional regulator
MQGKSRTIDTYQRLRLEILNNVHMPRARLRIDLLAESFGVSPGAVREALSRLTAEGLVAAEPQKGFIVAPVSIADLVDLTAVRIEVETRCLKRAIEVGDVAWESRIVASWHQLSHTPVQAAGGSEINDDWTRLHSEFHESLLAACDSQWWMRFRNQLYVQTERYRRLVLPYAKVKRDVDPEHKAIVEAVLARDKETACRLMAQHLQLTADLLLASDAPFDDASAKDARDVPASASASEARSRLKTAS